MILIFDANIDLPAGAVPPDPLEHTGPTVPLDHVISRDREGNPLSYVGDFVWNWTPYAPRGQIALIYFDYWAPMRRRKVNTSDITPPREARIRELQHLMVRLIYRNNARKNGHSHLRNRLGALIRIARFAESRDCSVYQVLQRQDLLDSFIATIPPSACIPIVAWLLFLWQLDPVKDLGFVVAKSRRWDELLERKAKIRNSAKQHAALPTRIYAKLINALASELEDIVAHKERLLGALRTAIALHAELRARNPNCEVVFGPAIIARYDLNNYLSRRGFRGGLMGLSGAVVEIFRVCKLQIHIFSGMRDAEAAYLPFHCMDTERRAHGRQHCLIAGVTTKLEEAHRRRTKWVTTESDGFRAILLAQQFSAVIYDSLGVIPSASEGVKDEHPLFLSVKYLPWVGSKSERLSKDSFAPVTARLSTESVVLRERLCPIIEEVDLAELEEIDPFRAWRDEPEYAVGQPWPLKTHQLRRSLALYANASGLVRLSSLRRQLQHITNEMSQYYGRGSAFAKNFLAEAPEEYKNHIIVEWQAGELEAQYLAFVHDVLRSDESLFGSAGTYYEMQKKRKEILSPEELKKQIKMGRLAYHAGPLGGCTNPGPCESAKGLRLIDITCATEGCKYLIGKHSKIIQTIGLQRAAMNHLDPSSITYQVEKEDLKALEATEALWRPQRSAVEAGNGDQNA